MKCNICRNLVSNRKIVRLSTFFLIHSIRFPDRSYWFRFIFCANFFFSREIRFAHINHLFIDHLISSFFSFHRQWCQFICCSIPLFRHLFTLFTLHISHLLSVRVSFLSHTHFFHTPVHSYIHSLVHSHSVRCRTNSHSVCFSFVPNLFFLHSFVFLSFAVNICFFFVFSSYSVPLALFLILCIRLSCNNRLYCSHIVLFALLFILICFFFSFYFQNADDTAVDYPNSATIFAAVCACLFIVIGIAGKCARFKWNRKLNIRFYWKKFVYLRKLSIRFSFSLHKT